jgi:hypothetical protein
VLLSMAEQREAAEEWLARECMEWLKRQESVVVAGLAENDPGLQRSSEMLDDELVASVEAGEVFA